MQYASKIKVNYEPQKIRYEREIDLPDRLLSLDDISKHLEGDEKFHFFHTEHYADDEVKLVVVGYRYETVEEVKARVQKEQKYIRNYELFHAKYRK